MKRLSEVGFPGEVAAVVQLYKLYSDCIGSTMNFGHPRKRTMTANRLFAITLRVVISPDKNSVILPLQLYFKETSLITGRKNLQGISLYIQSFNMPVHAVIEEEVPLPSRSSLCSSRENEMRRPQG